MKHLVPKNGTRRHLTQIEVEGGKIVRNMQEIPDALNNYFVESVNNIVSQIDKQNGGDYEMTDGSGGFQLKEFKLVSVGALRDIVFSMKKSGSPDEIDVKFLRNCFENLALPLVNLVNTSLETNTFPDDLKISTIVPIPKVANSDRAADFRPVNMLSCVEKVLERVVYEQLIQFIEGNNLLNDVQSGFRCGRGCETALQLVVDDWKRCLDRREIVCAVFLDLQRAFETVDRQRLIKKIERFGISDGALQWIVSYLDKRRQKLILNSMASDQMVTDYGVPQGSVLGPLLFLLYIDDIVQVEQDCNIHLFADDTLLYLTSTNVERMITTINASLGKIYQ